MPGTRRSWSGRGTVQPHPGTQASTLLAWRGRGGAPPAVLPAGSHTSSTLPPQHDSRMCWPGEGPLPSHPWDTSPSASGLAAAPGPGTRSWAAGRETVWPQRQGSAERHWTSPFFTAWASVCAVGHPYSQRCGRLWQDAGHPAGPQRGRESCVPVCRQARPTSAGRGQLSPAGWRPHNAPVSLRATGSARAPTPSAPGTERAMRMARRGQGSDPAPGAPAAQPALPCLARGAKASVSPAVGAAGSWGPLPPRPLRRARPRPGEPAGTAGHPGRRRRSLTACWPGRSWPRRAPRRLK